MPDIKLTPAQEAQIKAANDRLSAAKSILDSANTDAQTKLANLNRCNCGAGKLTIKRGGVPAGTCTPLMNAVTFPNLADPSQCIDKQLTSNCKTDCCSKSTCIANVNYYNSAVGAYNGAKANYDSAKANYDTIMAEISKDPTVVANTNIAISDINAQKSKDVVKWLFFGLAAVLIVGGAIFVGLRLLGGRA